MTEEKLAVGDSEVQKSIDRWEKRLKIQLSKSQIVVVEKNYDLVGFMGFVDKSQYHWLDPNIAYVVDTYIVPEARKTNAARRMFREFNLRIKTKYSEIWTNVNVNNKRVQRMLQKMGFKEVDDFKVKKFKDQIYFKFKIES